MLSRISFKLSPNILQMKKLFYSFLAISFLVSSCASDDKKSEEEIDFDQSGFLQQEANIIASGYSNFATQINQLEIAVDSFINSPNSNNLNSLQMHLKESYLSYQAVSHFEFGPASSLGFKSNVNIFATDSILIEGNIQQGNYNLDALSNKNAKGFPAIDYLLFHAADSIIIVELSNPNRTQYLQSLVANLRQIASTLNSDWNSYQASFIAAKGTDVGSGSGLLVNALNQHFERYFRDGKIGIPLGVRSSGIARPRYTEAFFGQFSIELAQANLNAMRNCYLGAGGTGLDDYLRASDAAELDQRIQDQMNMIDLKLNAIANPLSSAVVSNSQAVQELYNECQKLIVYWKVDLPSRLGILISYQDNDGD